MKVTGNLSNSTNNSQQRASSTTVRVSVHYKVYLVKHENNFKKLNPFTSNQIKYAGFCVFYMIPVKLLQFC